MPNSIEAKAQTTEMKNVAFVTFIAGELGVIIGAGLELFVIMSNLAMEKVFLALAPVVLGTILIVLGSAKARKAAKMEQKVI